MKVLLALALVTLAGCYPANAASALCEAAATRAVDLMIDHVVGPKLGLNRPQTLKALKDGNRSRERIIALGARELQWDRKCMMVLKLPDSSIIAMMKRKG